MQLSGRVPAPNNARGSLPATTDVGSVTLKVAELRRSLEFYAQGIGLQVLRQGDRSAILGAGNRPVVSLHEVPGARRQPPNTTGLYHAAILFPDRPSLAIKIAQLVAAGISLGQGDHVVSEAFYLSDPDGNGLELYRDRPRSEWEWDGEQVRMASDPVDVDGMFAEIRGRDDALANPAAPEGTKLGHMHLRVADVGLAERFYVDTLGFDVTARWAGALFVSAGGYHHHLGLNAWQSRGGRPPAEPSAGLAEFSLVLPDQDDIAQLAERVQAAGFGVESGDGDAAVIVDPFENRIRLLPSEQLR